MFLALSIPSTASAGSLQATKQAPVSIPLEVDSVSTGPRQAGKALRVTLLVYEVYYRIAVEEISYGLTEGDPNVVVGSYFLNGFDVAPHIGQQKLTWLRSVRWHGWNDFELQEQDLRFRVRYRGAGRFEIEAVKA